MNTEILGSVLQIVALVVLSYPLGRYIAKVYKGERTWLDFMAPVEKWMYKICGIFRRLCIRAVISCNKLF